MKENSKIDEMEVVISRLLRIGVVLSAIIIFAGLMLFLITGKSGYTDDRFPITISEIFSGAIVLKSYAIIMVGMIILILTPVFRVGVSIIVFVKEKDYLYTKITLAVFIILIISFVLGKVE
ncbi:DUF1634 domain-containing protein [Clostridium fungisolvens]|uniref:DUF1634 domain-containing protein n=1 Tax=Clostridium fungisolvens TaxID=1604897 RepID=A0A6V8SRI3_9CLOT|nr:DUF1634 domain-containing protein [Clostridium fungisolvens]GFP77493.1 hypothetical protein bsdtw1_03622 [Clostridium fungisolvens]